MQHKIKKKKTKQPQMRESSKKKVQKIYKQLYLGE